MPIFKQQTSVLARGIRAFLSLEVGLARDGATSGQNETRGLEQAKQEIDKQKERIASQDRQLQELAELQATKLDSRSNGTKFNGVDPNNIVWIFGSGRSGSTWLSSMMEEIQGHVLWGEPWVGYLFGYFYYLCVDERKHKNPQFILGHHRESWIRSIRNFVLDAAYATFPDLKGDDYLVIKEPNGSIGAPLLMEALPESRMVVLVRDPRDVVASFADARRQGGWHYERNKNLPQKPWWMISPDDDPVGFAEERATTLLQQIGNAKKAYDAHEGKKVLVRYEELRADTLGMMRRIYSTLGIPVEKKGLARAVEKHAWENVPEEEKGEGKFHRKASPGGWREDLTPEQARAVEKITAPLLEELYAERSSLASRRSRRDVDRGR